MSLENDTTPPIVYLTLIANLYVIPLDKPVTFLATVVLAIVSWNVSSKYKSYPVILLPVGSAKAVHPIVIKSVLLTVTLRLANLGRLAV